MREARDIQSFNLNCKTINDHYKSMRYPMNRRGLVCFILNGGRKELYKKYIKHHSIEHISKVLKIEKKLSRYSCYFI